MIDNHLSRNKVVWLVLVILLVGGGLLATGCGNTEEETKIYKIGFYTEAKAHSEIVEGFKAGMKDLGYIEGENITYLPMLTSQDPEVQEYFSRVEDDFSNWDAVTKEFFQELILSKDVDLIVTGESVSTGMALIGSEGTEVPIVFTRFTGVDTAEYVESYAHPGGRVTGVASGINEATGRRIEILKEIAPDIKKVLWAYPVGLVLTPTVELHRETAAALGLELVEKPLEAGVFESIQPGEVDAILTAIGTAGYIEPLNALIARENLPCMHAFWLPEAMAVYSADNYKLGVQASRLADHILRGTDPGSLPVEFPEEIELTIDLAAAKKIGLTIPEEVLSNADRVIPAEGSE